MQFFNRHTTPPARKLAERFCSLLLTARGSVTHFPSRGCNFLKNLRGKFSEADVLVAFAAARSTLRRQMKMGDTDRLQEDRFGSARIERIRIDGESLTLTVAVANPRGHAVLIDTPPLVMG